MMNCDHELEDIRMKISIGLLLVIFVMIAPGCFLLSRNTGKIEKPAAASPTPNAAPAARLTMQNFERLETDMTYEEVAGIIGSEGALAKASEIGTIRLTAYKWEGENFKRVYCSFRNNKLTVKSQSGL